MISRGWIRSMILLLWMMVGAPYGSGLVAAPSVMPEPPALTEAAPDGAGSAARAGFRLARMSGFDDDAAYLQSVTERVSELVALADQAEVPIRRIELLSAAANLILARQLEPACSSALLQLDDGKRAWKEADIVSALDQADALMKQAASVAHEVEGAGANAPEELAELTRRLETLRAFAPGLRRFLLPAQAGESGHGVRRAASRLSSLLEDEDGTVAAAARLWQACLRSLEADAARALSVLDFALAKPPKNSMPYALFARFQRCRVIAGRGGEATALALLMQIEERCEDWFDSGEDRANAVRAAQLVQTQILSGWHDRTPSDPGSAAQRQWCSDRIKALRERALDAEESTVFRLTAAIPIIVRVPDLTAEPTDPVDPAEPESDGG